MLTTLKLYNFQAHTRRLLRFDPRITTIRGRTDVGKSAILRALRWLALNDTGGEEFVAWGAEEAVAIVELEDGAGGQAKIVRRKGRENVYKLDGQVFKAFGAGKVPDPVAAVLALSEINFQRQHDKPFWLDDPAGEVSRQLNKVIDLSVIDTAMSNAAKMVRTARERVTVSESRLEEKRTKETESLSGTIRIGRFKLLKAKYDALAKIKSNFDQLEEIVQLADSVDVPALERRATQAGLLVQKALELRNVQRAHSHLAGLIRGVEECDRSIRKVPDVGPLSAKWIQLRQARAQWELLNELVENVVALNECIAADDLELSLMHKQLFKQACPTCGRKNEKP